MMARIATLIVIFLTSLRWKGMIAQCNEADHTSKATSKRDDGNHFGSCVCQLTCPHSDSDCASTGVISADENAILQALQEMKDTMATMKTKVDRLPSVTDIPSVEEISDLIGDQTSAQDVKLEILRQKLAEQTGWLHQFQSDISTEHQDVRGKIEEMKSMLHPARDEDNTPWLDHDGHFYLFKYTKKDVHAAKAYCELYRANLVSINTRRENDFLLSVIKGSNEDSFWTGGEYDRPNNQWVWPDGTNVAWSAWADNQPDDYKGNDNSGENYLEMATRGETFMWNDISTIYRTSAPFVCEWPSIM